MELDEITGAIVDAAIKIHMDLGPGLLESVYERVLERVLQRRGFRVERQKPITFQATNATLSESQPIKTGRTMRTTAPAPRIAGGPNSSNDKENSWVSPRSSVTGEIQHAINAEAGPTHSRAR